MSNYISVPVRELEKLEEARVNLYKYLSDYLDECQILGLPDITGQIWKVANTKAWFTDTKTNYWWENKDRNCDIFEEAVNGSTLISMAKKHDISTRTVRCSISRTAGKLSQAGDNTGFKYLRKHKDYWLKRLSEYRGL